MNQSKLEQFRKEMRMIPLDDLQEVQRIVNAVIQERNSKEYR